MKMFTSVVITAILAFTGVSALALPVADVDPDAFTIVPENKLERRSATVIICKDANYQGGCAPTLQAASGVCYNFPAAYNDAVSSYKISGGVCALFVDGGCSGSALTTSGNYPTIAAAYNDQLSSLRC